VVPLATGAVAALDPVAYAEDIRVNFNASFGAITSN
jgi:hypothetical protein